VIRPVDTSLLDAVAKTAPDASRAKQPAAASGPNAFAAQLKREAQKTEPAGPKADDPRTRNAGRVAPPGDEKWRPVKGRDDYAEIIEGPRKGQFVNLTRGDRRGEAFTIEERDGKKVHVYKLEGKDVVVPVEEDAKHASNRGRRPTPPKGETWGPVDGKPTYADILTGKRNGYYVNLVQGSVREGEIFHIVKRGDRTFHVYGEGGDKTWVEVGPNKRKRDDDSRPPAAAAPDNRDASQSTGGTSASSGASGSGGTSAS
jgi:hypothetical protein